MTQRFKENDADETKVIAAAQDVSNEVDGWRDDFFEGCFIAFALGDVLYELDRDPMVGVLTQEVYRTSFYAIHDLFTRPGTFEFYLAVFRSIWGDGADVQFTVPDPGKLLINVGEIEVDDYSFMARRVVDDAYVYDRIVDHDGNGLLLQDTTGTKNQSEVDALIEEISPRGIWTVANLTT